MDANLEGAAVSSTTARAVKTIATKKNLSAQSSMTLLQISYGEGKTSYSLVPIKQKTNFTSPRKKSISDAKFSDTIYGCHQCGSKYTTEKRLKLHQSKHKQLKNKSSVAPITVLNQQQLLTEDSLITEDTNDNAVNTSVSLEEVDEDLSSVKIQKKNLTYVCPSCEYSVDDRNVMINHFTTAHCFKASKIKINEDVSHSKQATCENADDEDSQEEQQKELEDVLELNCAQCNFSTNNQDDFDFHTCALPKEEQLFSCPLCTYECLTRMGLHSHITRKHKPRMGSVLGRVFECDNCDFKCSNRNTMYSHRRKHRKKDVDSSIISEEDCSYFCNECDFSTKKKIALYVHIRRRHKTVDPSGKTHKATRPELYSCDQCDYTNKNKYEVKVHVIRKHTNEYNYECETCGKKYKIRGDLTNHIRFQHREHPIICDVCGKTCGNSNSLYVHQKFAHYKAEFECPICHRRMVSQANLDEHVLKQHEQRENAVCEECGKTFTRQSRLKIHMRIHTGIKPHTCKICNKAFTRKTALRQHLLIHSGQRPYICDICGKAFTQKPGLISHRKSHPGSHPPLPRVTIDHVLSELLTEES